MYITETEIPPEWKIEIIHYLTSTVNKDGGWGLHTAGDSTVFATSLYYITLRILGLEPTHPLATKARTRLHALGEFLLSLTNFKPNATHGAHRRSNWSTSMGKGLARIVESVQLEWSEPDPT